MLLLELVSVEEPADMPVEPDEDVEVDGSVRVLLVVEPVLPVVAVPLAPMLDVPVEPEPVAPVEPVPLAPMLDVPLFAEDEVAPVVELLSPACALVASGALEALVPPPPLDEPPDCAKAMPPTARAAAAASVVRVFLVFVMSCSLNGLTPKGE